MKRRPIFKTEMWYNLTKRNSMGCFCSRKSNHSEASRGEEHKKKAGEMLTTVERRWGEAGCTYFFGQLLFWLITELGGPLTALK